MRTATIALNCYFTVPRVSKWAVFIPAPINWLAGDKSVVLTNDDFYIFGIVLSMVHRTWMNAQKSTLGDTTAYTPTTCFETFPFPQTPETKLVNHIRSKSEEIHQYRTQQMESKQWGITTLYNKFFDEPTSQLYKLHQQLDKLVMQAYGFSYNDDILEKLLEFNLELAEKEKQGKSVIGPWTPV
jgi:hypothetical protein